MRPRPEQVRSGPREPPPQGPKGAAVGKKDGGPPQRDDGQAAVQCKRTGDPTALGGAPQRSRSAPEARGRYCHVPSAKAVCAYAPGSPVNGCRLTMISRPGSDLLRYGAYEPLGELATLEPERQPNTSRGPLARPSSPLGLLGC